MRKLVFLNQEWVEAKNKTELEAARAKVFQESIKTFKEQMGKLFETKAFTILKEVPPEAVLIEYADVIDDQMWDALREADIVSIVDSLVPSDI